MEILKLNYYNWQFFKLFESQSLFLFFKFFLLFFLSSIPFSFFCVFFHPFFCTSVLYFVSFLDAAFFLLSTVWPYFFHPVSSSSCFSFLCFFSSFLFHWFSYILLLAYSRVFSLYISYLFHWVSFLIFTLPSIVSPITPHSSFPGNLIQYDTISELP